MAAVYRIFGTELVLTTQNNDNEFILNVSYTDYPTLSSQYVPMGARGLALYTDDSNYALGVCRIDDIASLIDKSGFSLSQILFGRDVYAAYVNDNTAYLQVQANAFTTELTTIGPKGESEPQPTFLHGTPIGLNGDRSLLCRIADDTTTEIDYTLFGNNLILVASVNNAWHLVVS